MEFTSLFNNNNYCSSFLFFYLIFIVFLCFLINYWIELCFVEIFVVFIKIYCSNNFYCQFLFTNCYLIYLSLFCSIFNLFSSIWIVIPSSIFYIRCIYQYFIVFTWHHHLFRIIFLPLSLFPFSQPSSTNFFPYFICKGQDFAFLDEFEFLAF